MNFSLFQKAVQEQFARMTKAVHTLYQVQLERDELWYVYLKSFPEGTDLLYRKRTEHDCSCCKGFIRNVGGVVAIINGNLHTIWDVDVAEEAYQTVANALSAYVKAKPISDVFLYPEPSVGAVKSLEALAGLDGKGATIQTWHHFALSIPGQSQDRRTNIPSRLGEYRATHDVFLRSLQEITLDAVETVLELIAQNSLYRGQEHTHSLEAFLRLKKEFVALGNAYEQTLYVWSRIQHVMSVPIDVLRIRNTVIGTLLIDISNGVELEEAVRSFEAKKAGPNYKRPTAVVSSKMVEQAKKTIQSLGLESALERRHARVTDLNISDIIFADRSVPHLINPDVFDTIAGESKKKGKPKNLDKIEEVPIEKFLEEIVPKAQSIALMVENRHAPNFVSLLAPSDSTAPGLFMWPNGFSWSYNGEMADSVKERVKKAGGNVTGEVCHRLAWYNFDDLDLHLKEPDGNVIYFASKFSAMGGRLDVDMNAGVGRTREPVENIFYNTRSQMREGTYELCVCQFHKRETSNIGFEVEVDLLGTLYSFVYEKPMRTGEKVLVVRYNYSKKSGFTLLESLPQTTASKVMWGVTTQTFTPVETMLYSPNYWSGHGVGNKHYFFMLKGCVNEGKVRGFYNEFLKNDLTPHRKVMEIVGARLEIPPDPYQLSGVGFSSTQRNNILAQVKGTFTRTVKILF